MSFYSSDEENQLLKGIELCRDGHFFDAHDEWESVWQNLNGRKKLFWQSLIQFVISCYHFENNNISGAVSMIDKAIHKANFLLDETRSDQIRELLDLFQKSRGYFSGNGTNEIDFELQKKIMENITDQLLAFENP